MPWSWADCPDQDFHRPGALEAGRRRAAAGEPGAGGRAGDPWRIGEVKGCTSQASSTTGGWPTAPYRVDSTFELFPATWERKAEAGRLGTAPVRPWAPKGWLIDSLPMRGLRSQGCGFFIGLPNGRAGIQSLRVRVANGNQPLAVHRPRRPWLWRKAAAASFAWSRDRSENPT